MFFFSHILNFGCSRKFNGNTAARLDVVLGCKTGIDRLWLTKYVTEKQILYYIYNDPFGNLIFSDKPKNLISFIHCMVRSKTKRR